MRRSVQELFEEYQNSLYAAAFNVCVILIIKQMNHNAVLFRKPHDRLEQLLRLWSLKYQRLHIILHTGGMGR